MAIKAAASMYDVARPPQAGVVILAYHRVGGVTELELDLDATVFRDQMAFIASEIGAQSLDNAVSELSQPASTQSSGVVVTFDDGTVDFMQHALPALVDHAIPATYYIATEFIEDQRSFPDAGCPLTWSALEEALSTGLITVGSHTHSHAVLDKLSVGEAAAEIDRSCGLIEDRLGVPARHFAYPKGVFGGSEIETLIVDRFESASLANCVVNPFGADPHRLERSPIQRSDGMRYFSKKVRGGLRLEGAVRGVVNAKRYRSRTN